MLLAAIGGINQNRGMVLPAKKEHRPKQLAYFQDSFTKAAPDFSGKQLQQHLQTMPMQVIPKAEQAFWDEQGVTITHGVVRQLFRHCAETSAAEVSHGRTETEGVTAAAVIGLDSDGKVHKTTSPNTTHRLSTQGTFSYCAERRVLDKLSDTKSAKYPITVAAIALTSHDMDKPDWLWRMGPCGDCLQRFVDCLLGNDPEIKMTPETLVFIPQNKPDAEIKCVPIKELIPSIVQKQPVGLKSISNIQTITYSDTAKGVFSSLPESEQRLIQQNVDRLFGEAKKAALTNVFVNGKGKAIGSSLLMIHGSETSVASGHNAKSNTRSQVRPFENALYHLDSYNREAVKLAVVVAKDKGVNVLDLGDLEQLAYMSKNPDVLIATISNSEELTISTYQDFIPYPYLTGSYKR